MRQSFRRVACLALLLASGTACRSAWPDPQASKYYWHPVRSLGSKEAALGNLRNQQGKFVSKPGGDIVAIEADDLGLRFRTEEEVSYRRSRPSSGGMFVGSNYVPVYGSTRETVSSTERDWVVIPLKEVRAIHLKWVFDSRWKNRFCVLVQLLDPKVEMVWLRAKDIDAARQIADSIATLAELAGAKILGQRIGVAFYDLDAKQWEELALLGEKRGALVADVHRGGPAEKAGVRFLDVILDVDGTAIRDAQHGLNLLLGPAAGSKTHLRGLRRDEAGKFQPLDITIDS